MNLSGCLLIGVLVTVATEVLPELRFVRPLFAVGLLGGYTTFSTYAVETRELFAAGAATLGALYAVGSVVGGICAVQLGAGAAQALARRGKAR